ncbi:MAG: hypothetical protein ACM3PZ_01515 [Bacillota bacterium]
MILSSALKSGLGFGLTSAVITTLGLMIGLNATTGSKLVVIGGILTIAIADSLSDALGVHVSKEAEPGAVSKEVWKATGFTFIFKLIFSLSFLIPVLLLELRPALIINVIWGLSILSYFSYRHVKCDSQSKFESVGEHLGVAVLVLGATYYFGHLISKYFG